jgi:sugar lactone lactonase YvrE
MRIARIGGWAMSAISVCTAAMLTACGGSLTAPTIAPPAQSGTTSSIHNDAGGCPLKRCIIVNRENGYGGKPPSVLFFARDANGNVSPAGQISGSNTTLSYPSGLAIDSRGNIYVANSNDAITVYAAGAEGNVAPIRSIAGDKTQLNGPSGLAIDSHDRLYVAENRSNAITVYSPKANGNVAPVRTIAGSSTNLYAPWGLAFDSQANLYVADDNPNNGWVTVYAPGAKGNAAPERTIEGSATKFYGPAGLAVDASGYLYVVNSSDETISIFGPGANGNVAPVSYFSAPIYAFGIALDGRDDMYITSVGYDDPPAITVFAAGATGNEGHVLRTIEGRQTKLIFPKGIIVR